MAVQPQGSDPYGKNEPEWWNRYRIVKASSLADALWILRVLALSRTAAQ